MATSDKSKGKQTGDEAADKASEVLRDERTSDESKAAAGSALSQKQAENDRTGEDASSDASEVLRRDDSSDKSKSAAGSALSQKQDRDD